MATNLAIDDNLLKTALVIGGLKTKKDTVNLALDEFIQRQKRQEVVDLFGKIDFDSQWGLIPSARSRVRALGRLELVTPSGKMVLDPKFNNFLTERTS